MKKDEYIKQIQSYMAEESMVKYGDKIIVGLSGGADSVFLLYLLRELAKKENYQLYCVHVNHGIRGKEADRDESFCKALCKEWEIPLKVEKVNVPSLAKERKMTEEEAGRYIRRRILDRVCVEQQGDVVALAHHKNDNVETLLMNLARGSGLKGLRGMRGRRGNVIRPLLELKREEIEEILEEEGVSYCQDETNTDVSYKRNYVRHKIIPVMEKGLNAAVVDHIHETMKDLSLLEKFLEEEGRRRSKEYFSWDEERGLLVRQEVFTEKEWMQGWILKDALIKVTGREKDIERVHIQMMKELLKKQTGRKLDLPYGTEAVRSYEGIFLRKKQEKRRENREIPCLKMTVFERKDFGDKEPWLEGNPYTKWFDYDIMNRNLKVRTREPGDYFVMDAQGKKQKLKDWLINEKIPVEEREHIYLLASGHHIYWIIGKRQGYDCLITKETKRIARWEMGE